MDTQQTAQRPLFNTDHFKELYKSFNKESIQKLPTIYSPHIIFKDPVHSLAGLSELSHYFASFCSDDLTCEFIIHNEVKADNQAFFQWEMHYQHPSLAAGKPLMLNGGTLIKFNSQITYHEDFYDMGAMLYQHIPVLGWAVRKVNARVAQQTAVKQGHTHE